VDQRLALVHHSPHHLAHHDIVIAHGHNPVHGALDGRQHAREHQHAADRHRRRRPLPPAQRALQAIRYGIPFGEQEFGSAVPGSGPTIPGDERPTALWRLLKEFDGWLSWASGPGRQR